MIQEASVGGVGVASTLVLMQSICKSEPASTASTVLLSEITIAALVSAQAPLSVVIIN